MCDRLLYGADVELEQFPPIRAQDDKRNHSPLIVLLIEDVLICRDEHFERRCLCGRDEVAVL